MAEGISPDTAASIAAQKQIARDSAASSVATAEAAKISSQAQQKSTLAVSIFSAQTELSKQLGSSITRGSSAA